MKPLEFDGVLDLIATIRWIINVGGCFYTCSCPDDLRVHFALNLLHLGVKDDCKFVMVNYSPTKQSVMTWERLTEIFRDEFMSLVERE